MTYLALARKYRPNTFEQISGQTHIIKALTHALANNQLHHAYLLTGTRGVGKTSMARIFAKCLNCESQNYPVVTPCNQCPTCIEIDQGRYLDVFEIDAASRTKVEDTRDLLENVPYRPHKGRIKVYLIDEVHMLSQHSFNALLKTLEEPPAHVKFLLATTDPQKLPVTVLSRCLQFHLKNISTEQIITRLVAVLTQENITYDLSALTLIAQLAQGSLRDALSVLDQAISHGNGQVNITDVTQMLGCTHEDNLLQLLTLIHAQDGRAVLQLIDILDENGTDFMVILDSLLSLLQKMAVSKLITPEQVITHTLTAEDIQLYYQILLISKRDMSLAPDLKSGFIMTVLRLMTFTPSPPKKQEAQEKQAIQAPVYSENSENWSTISTNLALTGVAKLLADHCVLISKKLENNIYSLKFALSPEQALLLTPGAKDRLTIALSDYYKKTCQITVSIAESTSYPSETPFQQKKTKQQQNAMKAENVLLSDPTVSAFVDAFDAELLPDSEHNTNNN